jgi:hypothetical protein
VLGDDTTVERPLRKHGHSQDIECIAGEYWRCHHRMVMRVCLGARIVRRSFRTEQVGLCEETGLNGLEIKQRHSISERCTRSKLEIDEGGKEAAIVTSSTRPVTGRVPLRSFLTTTSERFCLAVPRLGPRELAQCTM